MASAQLPNETLCAIFDNLSPASLATVVRASHRFRLVAERILYTNIVLLDLLPVPNAAPLAYNGLRSYMPPPPPPPSSTPPFPHHPHRTAACARTLLARPHLAACARRLTVRWQLESAGGGTPDISRARIALAPTLHLLNAALRTLLALEHLDLTLGPPWVGSIAVTDTGERVPDGAFDPRAVLADCAFPALRVLVLSGVESPAYANTKPHSSYSTQAGNGSPSSGSSSSSSGCSASDAHPDPDTLLPSLLARTPALEDLRLGDANTAPALARLPPDALPHLRAFRGSARAAARVLPGRPVRALTLVGCASGAYASYAYTGGGVGGGGGENEVTEADLRGAARASVPIVWLDLGGLSVTPMLLREVSRHLPDVEVLKVRLALRHTLHHALSGISLLAGLSQVLGAFPRLAQLDLSPTPVDGVGRSNALEESALCTTWARACPALRRVVFPSRSEWACTGADLDLGMGLGSGGGGGGGGGAGVGVGAWVCVAGGQAVWTRY